MENTRRSRMSVRTLVRGAILAAISTLLMFLDFPIPIFLPFMQFDFSDVPALVGGFSMGPLAGLGIMAVKCLINLLSSTSGGIGPLANFLVGTALVVPASLVYRRLRGRKGALLGLLTGIAAMCVMGCVSNYFVSLPFYIELYFHGDAGILYGMSNAVIPDFLASRWALFRVDSLVKVIALCIVPYNLFKGAVVSVLTFILHRYLGKFLEE